MLVVSVTSLGSRFDVTVLLEIDKKGMGRV